MAVLHFARSLGSAAKRRCTSSLRVCDRHASEELASIKGPE
jgi:hypothetical protein